MIILFGSYARGNLVEDIYTEGYITHEHQNDFDVLVVTKDKKRPFELLKKSDIDSRYKKEFKVTKEELEYLANRVRELQTVTEKLCKKLDLPRALAKE